MNSFFSNLRTLAIAVYQRLKAMLNDRDLQELPKIGLLLHDFWKTNLWATPFQRGFVIGVGVLVGMLMLILLSLQTSDIDLALKSEQAARAEQMIQGKLILLPYHNGLKLRLAHAQLKLGKEVQAITLIEEVVSKEPNNPYLAVLGGDVAQISKLSGRVDQGIEVLKGIPGDSCPICLEGLSDLYTYEGRRALNKRDLKKAHDYLAKALMLAEKVPESNDSIQSRRRELARVYEYQASQLIKPEEWSKAIEALEKANQLFESPQNNLKLARFYEAEALKSLSDTLNARKKIAKKGDKDKAPSTEDQENASVEIAYFKKGLDAYVKAYSAGLTESLPGFKNLLGKCKEAMHTNGFSDEMIASELQPYNEHEMAKTKQ
ncbi:MAG: hypothetical protein SFT81_03135 [Candidatus Caenarcaniphilales bacterium]|nr:hypothetical protein [Candidatus Caenarcaniphilales bacterium]